MNKQELLEMGRELSSVGNYKEAIKFFTQALALDPKYVEAYNLRGIAYTYLNDYEQAIYNFGRAIDFSPTDDHELYNKYFPNGGASIFTFEIKGGREEAWKFIDNLKIFSLLANVADVKSLVSHPASTTHSQLSADELAEQGIFENTIRLSIGTEHIDDIIADLENGFAAI